MCNKRVVDLTDDEILLELRVFMPSSAPRRELEEELACQRLNDKRFVNRSRELESLFFLFETGQL